MSVFQGTSLHVLSLSFLHVLSITISIYHIWLDQYVVDIAHEIIKNFYYRISCVDLWPDFSSECCSDWTLDITFWYIVCKYMYRNYSTQIMYSYSPFDNLHDIHQQTENLTYISYLWEMWHRRSNTLHITVILDSSDKQHVVYIYSFVFYILLYYRARDGRRFIRD